MALVEVIPLVGDNGEGGVLVIMKRTEPDVLPTLGLQHDMLAYERGQIIDLCGNTGRLSTGPLST